MIPTPYRFEAELTDQEFQKLAQLMLRWSNIEHVVGNCLKRLLRLTDEEAIVVVFPMGIDQRMTRIGELIEITPLSGESQKYFDELKPLMKGISYVRNSVVHSIVVKNDQDEQLFHLRSKRRYLSKPQIFSAEEITNYTAHVAIAFRLSLGLKEKDPTHDYALPDRPDIPDFLRSMIQWPRPK